MRMKLLIILPRFPYPTEKGDKLRAFNQIKILSQKHDVTLFALSHQRVNKSDYKKVESICKDVYLFRLRFTTVLWNLILAFIKGWPLQAGYYYSNKAKRQVDHLINKLKPDHLYCQLIRTAAYAKNVDISKTIDYQDVFSKGIERRIPSANLFMKIVLRLELIRVKRYEREVFDLFDLKTIISLPDRDQIPHIDRNQIAIIPNGVDHKFFTPIKAVKTIDLLFTGNMGYPPNIDCAEYLVKKVLPLIHKRYPGVKLTLAGASPHSRVKALASELVTVTGWVDDIREYYASAKIFLAPLQLGTGLQNKLLEAMSMKLPCITSSLCNSALLAREDVEILIGNNAEEVAEKTIKLLENSELRESVSDKGNIFVNENYSWQSATEKLSELMEIMVDKNPTIDRLHFEQNKINE